MKCVILQPSYIPWRGYFDLIHRAGVFVFYDDVQYDTGGWRNRNRIKTPKGTQWLTIPVNKRGVHTEHIRIDQISTAPQPWQQKHLDTLRLVYGSAPHFAAYLPWLERTYLAPPPLLADFTIATTIELARMLGISETRFVRSSELDIGGGKTQRLVNICRHVGASTYLSGPSARNYIEPDLFDAAGITLEYIDYNYPEYPQLYPPYDPQVTILDLLFMTGTEAPRYIWQP